MRRERERAGGEWVKNSGRERNFSRSKIGLERIKNKIRKDGLFDIKFIHLLKKKNSSSPSGETRTERSLLK